MVLNLSAETGEALLSVVDAEATLLLKKIKTAPASLKPALIKRLQHMGVAKHRLEYNLNMEDPFPGPIAWGYPRRPVAEPSASTWPFPNGGPTPSKVRKSAGSNAESVKLRARSTATRKPAIKKAAPTKK